MSSTAIQSAPAARPRRGKAWVGVAAAGIGAVAIVIVFVVSLGMGKDTTRLVTYDVAKDNLEIIITERGNLESQSEENVYCEVDDIEGDSIRGTTILWIIPNGSSVKKGDLIVDFDSSSHTERLDRQILDTEEARSKQIQARVKYENQKTQNDTSRAEAKLKVELAELALKQFEDEEGGTFQIELQDVELLIQESQAGRLIEETNLQGVEQLYKLGYRSRGELAQARLNALRAERTLASSLSKKKELVDYTYLKNKLQLKGDVESAKRALVQVERDNQALLEQAEAAMKTADEALKKEEERLARYKDQISKCKVYAPRDGMVAYATSGSRWYHEEVREGATIRPRQRILSIPNLKRMQVKTAVHESVLDMVTAGMSATVRVDAFPERSYKATVQSVAVLPDQAKWMASDTKVYETIVTIDEEVEQLKPGMTAVVEINVEYLEDVISVPVQAITQVGRKTWVQVGPEGSERREVELGLTNTKRVEIKSGLKPGDIVILNPEAVIDRAELEREIEASEDEEPNRAAEFERKKVAVEQRDRGEDGEGRPTRGTARPGQGRPERASARSGGDGRRDGRRSGGGRPGGRRPGGGRPSRGGGGGR